jgi:signal transduction histidine kinase
MKLYVESLLSKVKQTDDEQMTRVITRVMYQTEKLQDLVSDLLDVSKIQTGRLTFNREVFVINELIEETVQELQVSCPVHKLTFDSKKKIKVYADKFRVYQVLTNLITNAVKYSPDGGKIAVKISTEGKKITVSVTDKGIGIPKHQQKKIFEKLYQVTEPKEKTFPGLGMGLYISKEIVKRHKGNIWVESGKNKGSTFSFTLPAASFGKY